MKKARYYSTMYSNMNIVIAMEHATAIKQRNAPGHQSY